MFHTMDEARERGEQIAELAEDYAPKTEEERKEEKKWLRKLLVLKKRVELLKVWKQCIGAHL